MSEDAKNEYYKNFMDKFNGPIIDDSSSDDEYYVDPSEVNINDYIFASDIECTEDMMLADNVYKSDINIINILSHYYKQIHNTDDNVTMFDGLVNTEDSTATNKMMEFVYGEIFRYNRSNIKDKDILYDPDDNIDIDSYKELYCLMIEDEPKFVCQYILPITMYLATQDWVNIDWIIIDLHNA